VNNSREKKYKRFFGRAVFFFLPSFPEGENMESKNRDEEKIKF